MSFGGFIDFFQKGKVSIQIDYIDLSKLPIIYFYLKLIYRLLDQRKSFRLALFDIHCINMHKLH